MDLVAAPAREMTRGWQAELALDYAAVNGRTLLRHRHAGPLRIQRPFFPEGGVNHTYLLHPPGGLVGDDVLSIRTQVEAGAHGLITTPGATKAYRNVRAGASIEQRFDVEGTLEFLPQETILFDGSRLRSRTHFVLGAAARFVSWEVLCLGRTSGEQGFRSGRADFRTTVAGPDALHFDDRLVFDGGSALLHEPWGLDGCPVSGVMLAYPVDDQLLGVAREQLAGTSYAATRLDQLLVVRALERHSQQVRRVFSGVWSAIRPGLMGMPACAPRIWST